MLTPCLSSKSDCWSEWNWLVCSAVLWEFTLWVHRGMGFRRNEMGFPSSSPPSPSLLLAPCFILRGNSISSKTACRQATASNPTSHELHKASARTIFVQDLLLFFPIPHYNDLSLNALCKYQLISCIQFVCQPHSADGETKARRGDVTFPATKSWSGRQGQGQTQTS